MKFSKDILRAFEHKNYRNYYFLQFFSFIGTWIQGTAQSWLVYRLTHSALFLGATSFAGSISAIFLAPIAGVIADILKRKNILLTTQIACLIHGIIITILYFTNVINEWHILILAIFLGFANSFDMTARQSFIPLLVPEKDLTNAIALNSSMFNAARMIGPAVAGFLIVGFGEGACFVINIISYIPIIIFLTSVETKKQIIKKAASIIDHLQEGFLFAWKNKPIITLLMMVGTFSFWGASLTTLLPIFSDKILRSGAQGLGILTACSGIGAVSGGVFLASREKVIGIKKIIAFAAFTNSISLFIFAFSENFILSCIFLVFAGFSFILIFAGSNTLLQALSPDNLRGRVISLFSTMLMGMYPIGSLVIGFIGEHIGVSEAVLIGSVICFLVSIYFNARVPQLTKEAKELLELQRKSEIVVEQIS